MLSLITLLFKTIFSVVQRYRFKTWRFSNHKYKGIWVGLGLSMPERLEVRKSPFFFFLYVKDKIKLLILLRLWVRDWTDGDNNNEATWLRQWGKETETMTALNNPGWASSRSPGRIPSESRRPAEKKKASFQWSAREASDGTPRVRAMIPQGCERWYADNTDSSLQNNWHEFYLSFHRPDWHWLLCISKFLSFFFFFSFFFSFCFVFK